MFMTTKYRMLRYFELLWEEEECIQNFGSEIFCKIATRKAENEKREWLEGEMENGRKWFRTETGGELQY